MGELSEMWMVIPVSQVVHVSDSNSIWLVLIKNNNNKKGLRIKNLEQNQYVIQGASKYYFNAEILGITARKKNRKNYVSILVSKLNDKL